MMLRVWWKEDTGVWRARLTGKTLTGILVSADDSTLFVRRDDGEFEYVNPDDKDTFIKSAWVDRP